MNIFVGIMVIIGLLLLFIGAMGISISMIKDKSLSKGLGLMFAGTSFILVAKLVAMFFIG